MSRAPSPDGDYDTTRPLTFEVSAAYRLGVGMESNVCGDSQGGFLD